MSDITVVYIEGGTVAHYLDSLDTPNSAETVALCGRTSWPGMWFGTGDQDEEERAADLRVCAQCESIIKFRRNGYLTR